VVAHRVHEEADVWVEVAGGFAYWAVLVWWGGGQYLGYVCVGDLEIEREREREREREGRKETYRHL